VFVAKRRVQKMIQQELQKSMQRLVGIVRREDEMRQAVGVVSGFAARAVNAKVAGNREYNPGWHTALDLRPLLIVSEAVARAAIERRESRGAQFREDFPDKSAEFGKVSFVVRRGPDGRMAVERVPVVPLTDEQRTIVEEMK
jgi:succinate dehydrogenase / fumarate reductase flavoprotein subunit